MSDRIGFGQRLLAIIIDSVVIVVGGSVLGITFGGMIGTGAGAAIGSSAEPGSPEAVVAGGILGGILGMIAGVAITIWLMSMIWMIWEGLTGAALGKLLLKIRIKNDDGTPADVGKLLSRAAIKYSSSLLNILATITGIAILNTLGNIAGLVIFIGCFFVLGAARQAFHDMIAKTAVYPDRGVSQPVV